MNKFLHCRKCECFYDKEGNQYSKQRLRDIAGSNAIFVIPSYSDICHECQKTIDSLSSEDLHESYIILMGGMGFNEKGIDLFDEEQH